MGQHHTDIRQFRIFALILEDNIFVGKTTSPRISAVYSRHRCGSVAATRGILDQEDIPSLYILEQLNCTGADAYRHILAWIHLFEAAGYSSINHMTTALSSESLYPPTEAILHNLQQEPINQILARTYIRKPSDGNIKPTRKLILPPKQEKRVQMNLRMTARDKKEFDRFCKKHQLKAREALELLLDQITKDDAHLHQLLSAQKTLRQENEELKKRLAVQQEEVLSSREQHLTDYLQFLKKGLTEYVGLLCLAKTDESLPAFPYKWFRKQSEVHYEYPDAEGFLLLTTEAVLWGRRHARFVVGRGQDGEHLKIRYYPKPLYTGDFLWDYSAGTKWWIGCRRAADGAMEVVASFPIPRMTGAEKTSAISEEPRQRKMSLDDQIGNAAAKT